MIRKSLSRQIFEVCNTLLMLAICVVMIYPFLHVAAMSFSDNGAVQRGEVSIIPVGFSTEAYQAVLRYRNVWIGYRNTIVYTAVGTCVNLILTVCGAYALSRKGYYGRSFFAFMVAFTMFFGGGMIPTFLTVRNYKMLDTFWAMIFPGAISTWNMIVMRTFFQNIPSELEEAARMDGCSEMGTLVRIILPLSTASLMTIGMFYAVGHWNSWFDALIYLRNPDRYPLQLFLRMIVLQNQTNDIESLRNTTSNEGMERAIMETIKYAVIIVAVVPILCVYPFIQKYFVKGVMVGSIKG